MSKKSAFIFGVVAIFVLAGVLTLFWYEMQRVLPRESFFQMNVSKKESTTNATVTRVIDGDTFDVWMNETKETVRLLGIDTPETKDPRKQVQCFGREAHDKLASLIEGKVVRL
jgi:endonuclease YncB( thermonuclease family)